MRLINGDSLEVMKTLPENIVDSVVTDPPYGLKFMGKGWDHGIPGTEYWLEALRVAKPGAYLLAFGGTRTFHRLAVAIEDAGWEIRDTIMWVYGSGFPKSHNISKAMDKMMGAESEQVEATGGLHKNKNMNDDGWNKIGADEPLMDSNTPVSDLAKQWDGWGTALKPAFEPVIVARKPFNGTVADNVAKWGTGAMNIDGCRVGTDGEDLARINKVDNGMFGIGNNNNNAQQRKEHNLPPVGRWPANLIHDGSDEVLALFPQTGKSSGTVDHSKSSSTPTINFVSGSVLRKRSTGHTDNGGSAARFFYCPKASKRDRDEGLEGFEVRQTIGGGGTNDPNGDDVCGKYGSVKSPSPNHHPTVKPTNLMRYLCKLVTPPNGIILDPFMGSGSTGKAAVLEGFKFIGIEKEEEYIKIAEARINYER
jgi:site-specific DNA-methyltransferase (adenine-specific)